MLMLVQKQMFPEPTPVRLCFRFVYHFRFTREPIQIRSVRFLRAQATVI